MSDLIPSPYAFDSPEGIAERNAQLRGVGIAATSVLPAWMAQLSPYRVDDQGQGHWQLPGGALAAYSAAGELIPMVYNFGAGKLGLSGRLSPAPGAEEAGRQYQETKDMAFRTIPHMEPQTPDEQTVQDLATGTAGMAVPGAGYVTGPLGRGITSLPGVPRIAGAVTHMAIPEATTANALTGAAVTGGAQVLQERQQDQAFKDMGIDPAVVRLQGQPSQVAAQPDDSGQFDLSQPDTQPVVANPQSGAAAQVPFPTLSLSRDSPPMPNYGQAGETTTGWGDFLTDAAIVAAGGWILLKGGGKVFDPAYKFLTGKAAQIDTVANAAAHNANLNAIDAGRVTAAPGAPTTSGAARGEAPLPGKAGTVGTQMAQAGWDSNRVLTELVNATAPSRTVGEQLASELGTTNGSAAMHTRVGEQMATGVNDATGHVLPKLKDLVQGVDNLTSDQQLVWEKGMHASAELDVRAQNRLQLNQARRPYQDEDTRYNFTSTHTNLLDADRNAMLADPQTRALADLANNIHTGNINEGVAQGRISPTEATEYLAKYPHALPPTNVEGDLVQSLFTPKPSGEGWQTPNTRAIDSITQHYGKFYEGMARNTLNDNIIRQVETWQAADPARARIVSPTTPFAEGRTITVYREGMPHTYHINNTSVYDALKNNQAQANMVFNGMDAFRQSMQAGTTGVAATVVAQRPFSVISLLRNIPQIATDRAPGTHFGMIDQGLQRLTGGRIGSRVGLDPTQYIGSFNEAIRGSAAVTARNIADILRNPANPAAKMMRALKGDPWVDAAAQRMTQRYEQSTIAEARRVGATGGGSGGMYEGRQFNVNPRSTAGFNPLADQVPGVFHPDGIQIPYTKIALPGTRGLTSTYINLRTMLRDIHQAVSDGANLSYFKQNAHLSPERRALETRQVIGDPSMTGASPVMQRAGQSIAYLNPSIQDTVRAVRNFRDHPAAYISGTVGTLVLANAASLLTAMLGGKDHLNVLDQHMSSHDRASNIPFFHDMHDPSNYTEINLPQRWRVLNPMIQELLAYGSGAFQLRQGEDMYHRVIHSLADMFSQHVSTSTRTGMIQGASDFLDMFALPPAVQAGIGVAGSNVNPPIGVGLKNLVEGNPLNKGMVTDVGSQERIPGRQQSNIMSKDDNGWMQRLMSNIYGISGHALYDSMSKGWHNLQADPTIHGAAHALDGMIGTAGQSWRDNAPFGNMIWGNNVKLNYRNPMEDSFSAAMDKMRLMPKASDIYAEGYTQPGGLPIAKTGEGSVNPDPTIRQMLSMINNTHETLMSTVQPQITAMKRQLDEIDNDPYLDAKMQRQLHNQLVAQIKPVIEQADQQIKTLNGWMSHMVGKHVDVRSFNAAKGLEQFHD